MKRFMLMFALLIFSTLASTGFAGPPFNVDDPGTAETHHFNVEITYLSSQVAGSETQSIPSFSLGYGLTKNIELDLGLEIVSNRFSNFGRRTGFGDLTPAIKWRFQDETKRAPQFALSYQLKVPTASASQRLGTGSTDHALWLSAAKSFQRWQVFSNLGYNFLGDANGKNNLFYGLGLTYQVTETLVIGPQIYGNTANAPGSKDELAVGIGATYNFAPNRSLLLQVGRSTRGFSALNIYAGFGFTFK